jgi:hypothetical protein
VGATLSALAQMYVELDREVVRGRRSAVITTDSAVRTTWTMPRMPVGDSVAARRMAGELRTLADSLSSAQRQVDAALEEIRSSWRGQGSSASGRGRAPSIRSPPIGHHREQPRVNSELVAA